MNKIKALWNSLPDIAKRAIHTFYQAFISVFLIGITGIASTLLQTHNFSDAKTALMALAVAALAAAISAVKGMLLK